MRGIVVRYYIFQGLMNLRMFAPVLLLLYTDNGLSLLDVALLQALFSVAVIAAEVPAGIFADAVGHRSSLIVGALAFSASMVLLAEGACLRDFAVSEALGAGGLALVSGADKSLLYSALCQADHEPEFARTEGAARGLAAACQSAGALVGGALASVSLALPVGLSAGASALAAAVAFLFPARAGGVASAPRWPLRGILRHGWTTLCDTQSLRGVMVHFLILGSVQWAGFWLLQPLLIEHSIPAVRFGWVISSVCAAVFIASRATGWAIRRGGARLYAHVALVTAVALATIGIGRGLWVLPMFALLSWLDVVVSTAASVQALAHVPEHHAATVLSLMSVARRCAYAIVVLLVGWTAAHAGVGVAASGLACVATLTWLGSRISQNTADAATGF